jgi:hypothetical protein
VGLPGRWLVYSDVVIMRRRLAAPPPAHAGFTIVARDGYQPSLLALYDSLGRSLPEQRLQRRFERGLRFYELRRDGVTLASTWAASDGSQKFVDEIGLGFPARDGLVWLRDAFVAPGHRGEGLFAVLVDSLVTQALPQARELGSAVDRANRASMRAHMRYGHAPAARFRVLHLCGRLMLRLAWPHYEPLAAAFRPERRLLRTGEPYRRFIDMHLA